MAGASLPGSDTRSRRLAAVDVLTRLRDLGLPISGHIDRMATETGIGRRTLWRWLQQRSSAPDPRPRRRIRFEVSIEASPNRALHDRA